MHAILESKRRAREHEATALKPERRVSFEPHPAPEPTVVDEFFEPWNLFDDASMEEDLCVAVKRARGKGASRTRTQAIAQRGEPPRLRDAREFQCARNLLSQPLLRLLHSAMTSHVRICRSRRCPCHCYGEARDARHKQDDSNDLQVQVAMLLASN